MRLPVRERDADLLEEYGAVLPRNRVLALFARERRIALFEIGGREAEDLPSDRSAERRIQLRHRLLDVRERRHDRPCHPLEVSERAVGADILFKDTN